MVGEAVAPDATSWSDPLTRLDPGTYYVHVTGWDQSCADATDDPPDGAALDANAVDENGCEHVVSPTVKLVVRNAPPRVTAAHVVVQGTTVHATFTVCDDASGRATIILRQWRHASGRMLARYTRGLRLDTKAGCNTYHITEARHVSLGGRGKLAITLQVLDYDGGYSNVAVGKRGPPPT
jgi:hypothetical protein